MTAVATTKVEAMTKAAAMTKVAAMIKAEATIRPLRRPIPTTMAIAINLMR